MTDEVSTESDSDRVAQTSICDSAIFLTKVRDATASATGDPVATALGTDLISQPAATATGEPVATALGTDFMTTARPLNSLRKS